MTTKLQKWGGVSIAAVIVGTAVVGTFTKYHSRYALAEDVADMKGTLKDLRLQGRIQLLRGDRRELNRDREKILADGNQAGILTVDQRRRFLTIEDKLKVVEEDLTVLNGQRGKGER